LGANGRVLGDVRSRCAILLLSALNGPQAQGLRDGINRDGARFDHRIVRALGALASLATSCWPAPAGPPVTAPVPDDKKATEHLANERTFLAWVRTSISIMSLGFVVAKFGLWLRELAARLPGGPVSQGSGQGSGVSAWIGVAMIAFGGALAALAALRFHAVNRQIEAGKVEADRGLVVLITLAMGALALAMMAYVGLSTR